MKFGLFLSASVFLCCLASAGPTSDVDNGELEESSCARAMLGVATASVSPSLREYLGLDAGFGIQVHEVVEGTPAAESGLKQKDILVQLDDQLLISPEHLALLVNVREPGDLVEFHVIRQGERTKVEVTLGSLDPEIFPTAFRPDLHAGAATRPHSLQEQMRKQQEIWEQWMRNRNSSEEAGGEDRDSDVDPAAPEARAGFPIHVFGEEGIVTIDNQNGSVTLETEGGETQITIRNGNEEVIHEGMFDGEKGVDGLPEEARNQLKKMKLDDISQLSLPELPRKKISSPMPPAIPPRIL